MTLADEAADPGLLALLARLGYARAGRSPRSTSSSFATGASRSGWDRTAPGPALPPDVVDGTRERYREAFELLTGIPFARYVEDPEIVL